MHTINTTEYNVFIGNDSLGQIASFVDLKEVPYSSVFVLVDEITKEHCLPMLQKVSEGVRNATILEIKSGEEHKNIDTCKYLWEELNNNGADRKALLINLGGGVIGDMGGFVASTFKRGIDFLNIPTTLLSMVDASVGGKLGVDLLSLKNLIGVFNFPQTVIICPEFLKTLDKRQLISGFAEVIKHALIYDKDYFEEIKDIDLDNVDDLEKIIIRSVEIKNDVVTKDPKENGLRKILNFGHTIGHGIESYSLENDEDPLLHGEAVAIGMICEAYLSSKQIGLDGKMLNEIVSEIMNTYHPYNFDDNAIEAFVGNMFSDKKNENGVINFSFIEEIGVSRINQTSKKDKIIESLNFYKNLKR